MPVTWLHRQVWNLVVEERTSFGAGLRTSFLPAWLVLTCTGISTLVILEWLHYMARALSPSVAEKGPFSLLVQTFLVTQSW